MMHGKKANNLVVIENGILTTYQLDNKTEWEVGRPSKENIPDIKLHSTTVSRKHGKFQNMDGIWFYLDYNGKNGTVYNNRHINAGLNGRVKPVMLSDGDVFVFGGGEEAIINCKTIWAMYLDRDLGDSWRVIDSKGIETVVFCDESGRTTMLKPEKGTVVERDYGMAIYMGDITYAIGKIEVLGQ